MTTPTVGAAAPDFSVLTHERKTLTLADVKGSPAVIYFYPKDDTSGCTIEAKDFTSLGASFAKADAKVLGVSRDSVESHCKFIAKHDLGVTLLSDEEGKMCEAYGVWVEKSMYGKKYMGIERATFLIDANGVIVRIWPKVSVKDHAAEVLSAVEGM
jgi:thioredoxin-dependent peroxiredoxin